MNEIIYKSMKKVYEKVSKYVWMHGFEINWKKKQINNCKELVESLINLWMRMNERMDRIIKQ